MWLRITEAVALQQRRHREQEGGVSDHHTAAIPVHWRRLVLDPVAVDSTSVSALIIGVWYAWIRGNNSLPTNPAGDEPIRLRDKWLLRRRFGAGIPLCRPALLRRKNATAGYPRGYRSLEPRSRLPLCGGRTLSILRGRHCAPMWSRPECPAPAVPVALRFSASRCRSSGA